jgi:hypothetical protein
MSWKATFQARPRSTRWKPWCSFLRPVMQSSEKERNNCLESTRRYPNNGTWDVSAVPQAFGKSEPGAAGNHCMRERRVAIPAGTSGGPRSKVQDGEVTVLAARCRSGLWADVEFWRRAEIPRTSHVMQSARRGIRQALPYIEELIATPLAGALPPEVHRCNDQRREGHRGAPTVQKGRALLPSCAMFSQPVRGPNSRRKAA